LAHAAWDQEDVEFRMRLVGMRGHDLWVRDVIEGHEVGSHEVVSWAGADGAWFLADDGECEVLVPGCLDSSNT